MSPPTSNKPLASRAQFMHIMGALNGSKKLFKTYEARCVDMRRKYCKHQVYNINAQPKSRKILRARLMRAAARQSQVRHKHERKYDQVYQADEELLNTQFRLFSGVCKRYHIHKRTNRDRIRQMIEGTAEEGAMKFNGTLVFFFQAVEEGVVGL